MNQTGLTFKQRNKQNTLNLAKWTVAWLLTLAIASFGPHFLWQDQTVITVAAIVINILVGVMMILANKRQLQGMDELQQRVQLNAMGITLGASLVFGLAYSLLQSSGLVHFNEDISHLVLFMGMTYLVCILVMNKQLNDEDEA
jgi:peptidoglycan/LPS O-acetylase OafA/YrhL